LEQQELITDSSDQERERPTGSQEQEMYYSGYKKYTFKSMHIFVPKGKDIVDVILGEPGSKSDISQFLEAQSKFSPRQQT
jgi:hypothetical protein